MTASMILGQLLIGLINGSFYAVLSLGLALIFGLLNIINFAHGALYMIGAFLAWLASTYLGIGYWEALVLSPLIVGAFGATLERFVVRRTYRQEHLYGLLLTLGLATAIQGSFVVGFGALGRHYAIPGQLSGAFDLGFMLLPIYRTWVLLASIAICALTWLVVERTKLGSYLRAASQDPGLVEAFGIRVPRLIMLTFAAGSALAALAGVLAAPLYPVGALMGDTLIIVVFAVVVIGGMGSISGAIVTGFALGIVEALTRLIWPQGANLLVFIIMAIVLVFRPAGLFGKIVEFTASVDPGARPIALDRPRVYLLPFTIMLAILVVAPFFVYPTFLMIALCFALFAISVNLLMGFVGLGSFGQAMFLGLAGYGTGHAAKAWGLSPELAILFGTGCALVLGAVVGLLAIKRQKIYFSMITLALAEMVYFSLVQAPFTGGEDGLQSIPRGMLFGLFDLSNEMQLYFVVLAIFLLGFGFVFLVIQSPFGFALRAVRENELRAISLGYNTQRLKWLAFLMSSGLAGLAGATKAIVTQIATLNDAFHTTSGEVILMTLIGGVGTIFGPVVGAFAVVAMANYLAPLGAWVQLCQGLVFTLCVLSFRRGIVGQLARITKRCL